MHFWPAKSLRLTSCPSRSGNARSGASREPAVWPATGADGPPNTAIPSVGVDRDHQPHGGAEPFEVHQTVDHQVRGAPHGHADVALAQPRVLQLPPRRRAQIVDRNKQPLSISPPSDTRLVVRRPAPRSPPWRNLRERPGGGVGAEPPGGAPTARGGSATPERQAISAPGGRTDELVGGGRRPPTTKTARAAALARPRRGWRGRPACCRRCRARRTRRRPVRRASAPWPTRC